MTSGHFREEELSFFRRIFAGALCFCECFENCVSDKTCTRELICVSRIRDPKMSPTLNSYSFLHFCFANVSRSAFSTSTTLGPYRFSFSNSLRFTRYDFAVSQLYTMFDDFCLSQKGESQTIYPDDPPHRAQVGGVILHTLL